MQDKNYIIAKIQKLLSLSRSPNEHEAKRALSKAQELMLKHQIAEAELGAKVGYKAVSKTIKYWKGRYLTAEAWLCGLLAREMCCEIDTDWDWDNGTLIKIFGRETEIEIAAEAIVYAYKAFASNWKKYFAKQSAYRQAKRKRLRVDYCYGFCHGLASAMRESVTSNALVVTIPEEVKQARIEWSGESNECATPRKPQKRKKVVTQYDKDAVTTGFIAGNNAHSTKHKRIST